MSTNHGSPMRNTGNSDYMELSWDFHENPMKASFHGTPMGTPWEDSLELVSLLPLMTRHSKAHPTTCKKPLLVLYFITLRALGNIRVLLVRGGSKSYFFSAFTAIGPFQTNQTCAFIRHAKGFYPCHRAQQFFFSV